MSALGVLLVLGTVLGLVIAFLGHPKFYKAIFGGRTKSLDYR